MRLRLWGHVITLTLLIGPGVWFVYDSIYAHIVRDLVAAMYCFTLLVYILLSSICYLLLRRRSTGSLVLGHLVSVVIAIAAAVVILVLGQAHEASHHNQDPPADASLTVAPRLATDYRAPGNTTLA